MQKSIYKKYSRKIDIERDKRPLALRTYLTNIVNPLTAKAVSFKTRLKRDC